MPSDPSAKTSDDAPLEKRTWVYVQRPAAYCISGCTCGNADPDWSEFKKHLWCAKCEKDSVLGSKLTC